MTSLPDTLNPASGDPAPEPTVQRRLERRGFWLMWAGWLALLGTAVLPASLLVVGGSAWLLAANPREAEKQHPVLVWTGALAVVVVGMVIQIFIPVPVLTIEADGPTAATMLDVIAVGVMVAVVLTVGRWWDQVATRAGQHRDRLTGRWQEVWAKWTIVGPALVVVLVAQTVGPDLEVIPAIPLFTVAVFCEALALIWYVRVLGSLVREALWTPSSDTGDLTAGVYVIGVVVAGALTMAQRGCSPPARPFRFAPSAWSMTPASCAPSSTTHSWAPPPSRRSPSPLPEGHQPRGLTGLGKP